MLHCRRTRIAVNSILLAIASLSQRPGRYLKERDELRKEIRDNSWKNMAPLPGLELHSLSQSFGVEGLES